MGWSPKHVFWTVAALCLVLGSSPAAEKRDQRVSEETAYERLRTGVAHLGRAGMQGEQAAIQWLGTAFLVDERCTVVTAKHAIESIPDDQLVLRFLGDAEQVHTYPARVVHEAEADLAFLTFGPENNPKRFCGQIPYRPIPIHAGGERVRLTGRTVWVLGYPALEGAPPRDVPIVRRGIVASAELDWRGDPMLLLDVTGMPGFSGGPVILESSGEAVGVVYGPGRTERVYDVEWATPLSAADYDRALTKAP